MDKFIKSNPNYDWKKTLAKEGINLTQKVSSDLDKFRKGQLEMSANNYSGLSGKNTTVSNENKPSMGTNLKERMAQVRDRQNELNNSMSKQDAFKNKMNSLMTNKRPSVVGQPAGLSIAANTQAQQNLNSSFSEMNQKLSNKWAQINQSSSRGAFTGRDTLQGAGGLANTMRHTTAGATG